MNRISWLKRPGFGRLVIMFSIGLFLIFLGGGCVPSETEQGHWSTGAPALTKRSEAALAVVGGFIYTLGGFEEQTTGSSTYLGVSKAVEMYDPQTDRWEIKSSLPIGLHHAGAAVLDNQLYVAGGFSPSESNSWRPVNTLFRYNPMTDQWIELKSMPTPRGALGVSAHQGKLYAISGYDGKDNPAVVEVYDPRTNSWSSVSPIPTPRDHLAVVTQGHRIYAIGGRVKQNYHKNLRTVEMYDPEADQWTSVTDMPTPRSGITAGVLHNQIYVLGGESGKGTFAENERYDPQTNIWETMLPLPTARHGLGAAVIENRLYVVSGGTKPGMSASNLNEIYIPPGSTLF